MRELTIVIVIIADEQIFLASRVCQHCLMAERSGLPRWREDRLRCGTALQQHSSREATVYRCHMGFNVAQID